jgi:hypothetical protein
VATIERPLRSASAATRSAATRGAVKLTDAGFSLVSTVDKLGRKRVLVSNADEAVPPVDTFSAGVERRSTTAEEPPKSRHLSHYSRAVASHLIVSKRRFKGWVQSQPSSAVWEASQRHTSAVGSHIGCMGRFVLDVLQEKAKPVYERRCCCCAAASLQEALLAVSLVLLVAWNGWVVPPRLVRADEYDAFRRSSSTRRTRPRGRVARSVHPFVPRDTAAHIPGVRACVPPALNPG